MNQEQVREIAWIAWKGAANAFRMYPDNKHTFTDYWNAAKDQFTAYSTPEQGGPRWVSILAKEPQGIHYLKGCRLDKGLIKKEFKNGQYVYVLYKGNGMEQDALTIWDIGHPELKEVFWLDESSPSPAAMVEQPFFDYISSTRETFVKEVDYQMWSSPLRTSAESLLIAYDQMAERLKPTGLVERGEVKAKAVIDEIRKIVERANDLAEQERDYFERNVHHYYIGDLNRAIEVIKHYSKLLPTPSAEQGEDK